MEAVLLRIINAKPHIWLEAQQRWLYIGPAEQRELLPDWLRLAQNVSNGSVQMIFVHVPDTPSLQQFFSVWPYHEGWAFAVTPEGIKAAESPSALSKLLAQPHAPWAHTAP